MTSPYAYPAPQPPTYATTVAPGTPVHTRWGWVTAWLPVATLALTVVQLLAMSTLMRDYFRQLAAIIAAQRTDPSGVPEMSGLMATMMPMTIASLVLSVLSWGILALGVVAASLDYKELGRLGYPRRFHWAWNFLSPVYPIGRAVVVHRQAGAGLATMWIAVSATAASYVISAAWTIWLMLVLLQDIASLRGVIA